MVIRMKIWQVSLTFFFLLSLLSWHVVAETQTNKLPKWKLEHQASITNSAKVCSSPLINEKVTPNNLTTGFYTITLRSMPNASSLEIDESGHVDLQKTSLGEARRWLLTHIGGANYDVATCFQGQPVCLSIDENTQIAITKCDEVGYGGQTWWFKGYGTGKYKGAWFFGNDGLGQMDCLVSSKEEPLFIHQCNNTTAWDIARVAKPTLEPSTDPIEDPVALAFPDGAPIIHYQCESGSEVEAHYDNQNDRAFISYNDELLILNTAVSASGVKYGDNEQPWGWWTKGASGYIYQIDDDDLETVIENCSQLEH